MFDLRFEGAIAWLRLDRPERRNAIPAEGWVELARTCTDIGEREVRALVVAGSSAAFSAGADLGEFPAFTARPDAVAAFRQQMREGIEALAGLPIPALALVEGPCFGAAVALAMACDLRIAGPGARFAITPAKLGISYPQQDVARLVSLVGPGQASRLLFGGAAIDAAEAMRIGLVEIVADDVHAALASVTDAIVANSAASVALLKRQVRAAAAGDAQGFEREFDARFASDDFAVRLEAFRAPR